MRMVWIFLVAAVAALASPGAGAHELWLHSGPGPGTDPGVIRLTFGDGPELGQAERVAEIANAKVWAGGKALKVKRLPDGLEAQLPAGDHALVSALADRGVVTHTGQSSVIYLAAYSQIRAIEPDEAADLGLGDDQVRLLLFSRENGPPVVRAIWKGKPAPDAAVKIFHGAGDPIEARTDSHGEIPCPDLKEGPWSLLVQVAEKSPASATAGITRRSDTRPP